MSPGLCPHCGEPLDGHATTCRPYPALQRAAEEARKRVLAGLAVAGAVWTGDLESVELGAAASTIGEVQAEARAILAEWDPGYCGCQASQRIHALLVRIAGGET